MKKAFLALLATGVLTLAACGGGNPEGSGESDSTAEPCFLDSEVAQLAFEWKITVASERDNPNEGEKAQYADEFAERVKDMSWGIPEGSDCIGYRESMVLTKEALVLAEALDNGKASATEYENAAKAGDDFMEVASLEEKGYSVDQISFPTDPEEARRLIPGQGS